MCNRPILQFCCFSGFKLGGSQYRSTQHRGSSEGLGLALPPKCETQPQSGESGPARSGTVGHLEDIISYQLPSSLLPRGLCFLSRLEQLVHYPLHKRTLLLFLMRLKRTAPVSLAQTVLPHLTQVDPMTGGWRSDLLVSNRQ